MEKGKKLSQKGKTSTSSSARDALASSTELNFYQDLYNLLFMYLYDLFL